MNSQRLQTLILFMEEMHLPVIESSAIKGQLMRGFEVR